MYNLFHASDPTALRIEPLVNYMFKQIPPIEIARYNRFPMGDGESVHLGRYWVSSVLQLTASLFSDKKKILFCAKHRFWIHVVKVLTK